MFGYNEQMQLYVVVVWIQNWLNQPKLCLYENNSNNWIFTWLTALNNTQSKISWIRHTSNMMAGVDEGTWVDL